MKFYSLRFFTFLLLLTAVLIRPAKASEPQLPPSEMLVYIGTYTRGSDSQGIYLFKLDLTSGKLKPLGLAAKTVNPSFLAIHSNKQYLYAVSEVQNADGKKTGAVVGFSIDADSGKLKRLNHQSSEGQGPCHLVVDQQGKNVLVANYGSGSIASLPIDQDGKLKKAASAIQHTGSSVNPSRQKSPHAHSINLDRTGRFAFAADLGIDKILVYQFNSKTGKMIPSRSSSVKLKPGAGPRHFAVHPNNQTCYVINELHCTVTAFQHNSKDGSLKSIQTISTLPKDTSFQKGYSTAEVQVHPSGKFLYGSNRGHNSIAVYSIDKKSGKLTHLENVSTQGKTPRNFGIDPTGKYLIAANQSSDNLVVFKIDQKTGKLKPTGVNVKCPRPVCVKFFFPTK